MTGTQRSRLERDEEWGRIKGGVTSPPTLQGFHRISDVGHILSLSDYGGGFRGEE